MNPFVPQDPKSTIQAPECPNPTVVAQRLRKFVQHGQLGVRDTPDPSDHNAERWEREGGRGKGDAQRFRHARTGGIQEVRSTDNLSLDRVAGRQSCTVHCTAAQAGSI